MCWRCWTAIPGKRLSELRAELPVAYTSLTMSPHCDDEKKYGVVEDVVREYQELAQAGGTVLGRRITEVITVNGVRVALEDGSWVLVRASSNKPELVVVVESQRSADDMRALFRDEVKPRLAKRPGGRRLQSGGLTRCRTPPAPSPRGGRP
jgi:phosphomannomutase/phosphoglucomutase